MSLEYSESNLSKWTVGEKPQKVSYKKYHVYKKGKVHLVDADPQDVIEFAKGLSPKPTHISSMSKAFHVLKSNEFILEEQFDEEAYKKAMSDYRIAEAEADLCWKEALGEHYGYDFVHDKFAQLILSRAWDEEHSGGLQAVEDCLAELIEFVDELMDVVKEQNAPPEEFFVTSDGDSPKGIYFTLDEAIKMGEAYIDYFDKNGNPVQCYKRVSEPEEPPRYTVYR